MNSRLLLLEILLFVVVLSSVCTTSHATKVFNVLDYGAVANNKTDNTKNINNLRIYGGGTLDGQGASAWPYNNCGTGSCNPLPVSLRLDFINDSEISNINSINSKNFHFNVFSCYRLRFSHVTISAPTDSPNTDGIHIGGSGEIAIDTADIATGDDCVSIGSGNQGINISNVYCGPGHGISVGSMGRSATDEEGVSGVAVVNCTFRRTLNGVQIKTWPDSKAAGGFASDFVYDNIVMENGSSKIQISNITFRNIHGTCTTRDAVKLVCSKINPCHDIALENINLIGPVDSLLPHAITSMAEQEDGKSRLLACTRPLNVNYCSTHFLVINRLDCAGIGSSDEEKPM
ncbi:hypothetical protein DH2020_031784 [Rehmannia glutinosa]|uniref:Polygalacturonase n=1 Tax=Rehmannia glutinosa TaxID=99300 RepID=A0ABR0VHT9_REHGL